MVPCQPKQLVILSLPFAALVAFLWFKRRKSSSHSDPGGTLAMPKPVDTPIKNSASDKYIENISTDGKELGEKIAKKQFIKETEDDFPSVTKVEEPVLEKIEHLTSTPCEVVDSLVSKKVESLESSPRSDKTYISCNGGAVHIKDNLDTDFVNPATPQLVNGGFYHSTPKVTEKSIKATDNNLVNREDKLVEESLECSEPERSETIGKTTETESTENNSESGIIEDLEEKTESQIQREEEFKAFCEQSTVENSALLNFSDQSTVENSALLKTRSEEESMAQGQTSEEKTESNAAGLEQKLASLGLDTQQPPQRSERDSANHSPAEVMLNSPAISTFSDAHSEGSSDSGKGCSDVVTPPSRTPAGGSSVAGDQVPIVYEFVLPQVIVGRLIGRHGTFLHDIRAKTHTNVFIKRHPETNSLKICAIEGTQPDIDAALKMIRQKFPLRRFPDLTLERVTFVKNPCLPISPENLQLHLVEGVNNDVILSSLITAGHFFLQMPMHISYQSLYRLTCIMNSVYNTQESPPLPDPQPDVVCVAPAQGGWYRAQILTVDEEAHTSDIRFLDYGGFLTVDNSLLRQIRGDFLLLPFQAVECALANVIPAGGEEEWSEEAKQFVQLMTHQQTLQAQVYDYTETGIPLVYLYCTQFYQSPTDPNGFETRVVLLNQELVSRGFADLIDPSQADAQTTATESS